MTFTPRFTNLIQLYTQSVEQFGPRPLFGTRKPDGWHWTSYAQFKELVSAARSGLAAAGIRAGDRVAVISNNRLEWAVTAYGAYSLGAIYVPMYEAQLDKDWAYVLNDCGARICFAANNTIAERLKRMSSQMPQLEQVIAFDDPAYEALLASGRGAPIPPITPADQALAIFIYTSGTTGVPKGVRLTHYNLAANVCGVLEVAPLESNETSLAFLPWAHVFGGCVELNALMAHGDAIAICDNTDRLIDYLSEVKPTLLFAVPRIWNRIYDGVHKQMAARPRAIRSLFELGMQLKSRQTRGERLRKREQALLLLCDRVLFAKVRARFGGRLRFAFSGAAALAPEVAEFIDNLGIEVFEGYGLTETSGACTANRRGARRRGSVGMVVPGFQIKIARGVTGADAEGEGEIIVYGSGVMQGYHNAADETSRTLTEDGGLRTGDLGRFDTEGFLYITGRVKELFKLTNGKYVAPVALEEKLQLSPYIAQAFVYGSDRPGNSAVIVVDLASLQGWAKEQGLDHDPAKLLTDARTLELFRKEIDVQSREFKGYEQIRQFILEAEPFTTQNDLLTPTFKIKRRNLNNKYGSRLDALYPR